MGYKALYRSYRPTTFKEVIGQKHVIQTLKNAVVENRTSHAYVFSGLRGIGKTTIARILAKAVNCLNPVDGEPCNECANCKAINEGITTDVVELDAASNNGVDEIRALLEKVNYLPSFLAKKVYIVDEVHMLSTAAFNALLKTLEEPPAYVMFILATTEPHKIPMTILSRCQRFDFKQFTISELTQELNYICEKENIIVSDEALNGIAEAAEGGMRDALSILDQASVFADGEITVEDVNSVTGNISNQKIIQLLHSLNTNDATAAISNINELINMGKEVSRLITNVIQFCRDVLLYKSVNESPVDKYIYTTDAFKELVEETDNKRLFYYIDVLVDVQNKIRFTNSQKIYLEVGIMKIVNSASEDIDLLGRIQELEYRLNNGESFENKGSFIPGNNSFEQRLNNLENKIKKLSNDLEKANISTFEETINGKISLLEDVVSKTSALPNTIEQRITILENRVEDLETGEFIPNINIENNEQTNESYVTNENQEYTNQLIKLESELSEYITKTNAILTTVTQDLENLKNDSDIVENSSSVDEEVILELIDKITQLESRVSNIKNSETLDNTTLNADLTDKVCSLNETVEKLKNKVDVIYQKGYTEVSFESLFDVNTPKEDDELAEALNELIIEFNSLKEEVNNLKLNGNTNFSLYNKDCVDNSQLASLTNLVNEIDSKLKILENNNVTTDSGITNSSDEKYEELTSQISEIKINYFVLTQALTLMKEKYESLQISSDSQNVVSQIESISTNLNKLTDELNEIKTTSLNYGALNDYVERLENLSRIVKELEEKIIDLTNNKEDDVKGTVESENISNNVDTNSSSKEVVKDVVATLEPVNEPVIIQPIQSELIEEDLTATIFNIKIIENILHEARLPECKAIKEQLINAWQTIESRVGGQLMHIANLLSSAKIVANGKTHLILVYTNAQLCNHIMNPKQYENAKEVIKVTLGKAYDFIALPDDTWREKRLEYHDKFRVGDVYPVLTPINNPKLRVVVRKDSPKSDRELTIEKANDFFGIDE